MGSPARTLSAAEAKAHFADCLRAAEAGSPFVVTRHGRPVAAIIGVQDWKQVQRLRSAGPSQGLAGLVDAWPDSGPLVESVMRVYRERRAHSRRRR